MVNNFIFILTEGDHDAAFIYRILKANGFKTYSEVIGKFPPPLAGFLQQDIFNVSIPEVKIQQARSRFLPQYTMELDRNLVLIYSIGGDSKGTIRTELVKALNAFNIQDDDGLAIQALPEDTHMSVLFFFDADDKGSDVRVSQMVNELKPAFPEFTFQEDDAYSPSVIYSIEDMRVGAFVFRSTEEDKGMLEDILLPLMQKDNQEIFDAAETFLEINKSCQLFKDKLKYDESGTVLKKVNGITYSHRKSLIGTAGQLQKSGMANTVHISQTDYLNNEKILGDDTCKSVFAFIKQILI